MKINFFQLLPMQNHASSLVWVYPRGFNCYWRKNFQDEENAKLLNYSRLLTHTDSDTQSAPGKSSKIDKKITVVFLRSLAWSHPSRPLRTTRKVKYQTDYFYLSTLMHRNWTILWSIRDFSAMAFWTDQFKSFALLHAFVDGKQVSIKALEGEAQEIGRGFKWLNTTWLVGKVIFLKTSLVPTNKSN